MGRAVISSVRLILEWTLIIIVIAGVVAGNQLVWTSDVGLALVLHVVVLGVSALRGLVAGLIAAIAASAGLAFLFDPMGSLRVDEASSWMALASFLFAAAFASRLVTDARNQAQAAGRREDELSRLYQLSVTLFGVTERANALEHATATALAALGATSGALLRIERRSSELAVTEKIGEVSERLLDQARTCAEELETVSAEGDPATTLVPRDARDHVRVLIVTGSDASRSAIESAAALLSLAAEHERFLETTSHLEALRESDRLKTGILRAVSHDLATPLATITLELEALEREVQQSVEATRKVANLRQDTGMLRRRIENLLAMARIEAGTYRPNPEPLPPADLFRNVRHHLSIVAPARPVEVRIDQDCPDLEVDPSLALEIIGNLVDNAHRASPEGVPIELVAACGENRAWVDVEVLDRGHGLRGSGSMSEGDALPSGLGLEIARTLAAASRATLLLEDREGGGTRASVRIPASMEIAV